MYSESASTLLLGTPEGKIFRYDKKRQTLERVAHSREGKIYLRCIQCIGNEIWLGTHNGLIILNKDNGSEVYLEESVNDRFSLSNDAIYCFYKSNSEDVWIGTFFGGVNYRLNDSFQFDILGTQFHNQPLRIRGLTQAVDGRIWFGTEDLGFGIYDPQSGKAVRLSDLTDNHRFSLNIAQFNDRMLLSSNQCGVDIFNAEGKKDGHLEVPDTDGSIYSSFKDSQGNEWLGFGSALYRRTVNESEFKRINQTGYDWIFTIFEDSKGVIWLGTMGNGLWRYNPRNGLFKKYVADSIAVTGLRSNCINSFMEDSKGRIWVSTDRGGISCYDAEADRFVTYSIEEGLPDNVAYKALEDNRGNLWFGTNNGLVKFNPHDKTSRVFTEKDGLPGNQFNYHSALKASDGRFYFGGISGLIAFNPAKEQKQPDPRLVYFSQMYIGNEPCHVGEEGSPLSTNILFAESVELPYDSPPVSFDVVSPTFGVTGDREYTYRLLPTNKEWQPLVNNHISFYNLSPGRYTLEVKVSNAVGWCSRELSLVILPPWWQSGWAYACYILLLLGAFTLWFVGYRRHKNRQMQMRQKIYTAEMEQKHYRNKVKFFTEIAHEIRTPLSLIEAPLEAVEEIGISDKRQQHYIHIVRKNVKRLLNLVGDLLDFQKIDTNKLTIKYENIDLVSLVNETANRFEPSIELHNKVLHRIVPTEPIIASTDKEAVTKVLSNLLNNALKYANREITVQISSDIETFTVRVVSDGKKISKAQRHLIFERFYRLENRMSGEEGIGLGLNLAQNIVLLLGGCLTLEDTPDVTNSFAFTLPLNLEAIERNNSTALETTDYVLEEESNLSKDNPRGNTILLVEDNESMRNFIASQLAEYFSIETAANGREALDCLKQVHIDLILTDVMMPLIDGFELCKTVKKDSELSHIPVIFITAKNDLDSKIKGLQLGAEGYIEKPFSIKYVRRLISSILDNRRLEREAFSKKPFFSVDSMQTNKADEEFINRVVVLIEEHLQDEKFNVEMMADKLCMSRSSLLRKIKTLFNLQPVELIRVIKLKKAAGLIQDGRYRIGEICYMVGFTSPSYFSKQFFKQFGVSPKDFEKQCHKAAHEPAKVDETLSSEKR